MFSTQSFSCLPNYFFTHFYCYFHLHIWREDSAPMEPQTLGLLVVWFQDLLLRKGVGEVDSQSSVQSQSAHESSDGRLRLGL